ncbi:MAG: hypothetical protein HY294_00335 [Candidatus Rokubacteria bacterium]|nr:hypothetical protein [Candidatus Rokubacteria bacterium]
MTGVAVLLVGVALLLGFKVSPAAGGEVLAVALLMLSVLASAEAIVRHLDEREDDRVPCPRCAEPIRAAALICPFCHSDLASGADRLQRGAQRGESHAAERRD